MNIEKIFIQIDQDRTGEFSVGSDILEIKEIREGHKNFFVGVNKEGDLVFKVSSNFNHLIIYKTSK